MFTASFVVAVGTFVVLRAAKWGLETWASSSGSSSSGSGSSSSGSGSSSSGSGSSSSGSGSSSSGSVHKTRAFVSFQTNYIVVYLLAMLADWLKGPYVYVLYESYGFSQGDIALLFMAGFAASMVFGTVAGSVADTVGRRKLVVSYAVLYGIAALSKAIPSFWVLLAGRIASGIATSLLFSVFEAWMVCEHNARGFDPTLLSDTFAKVTTGNGMVAVGAGLLASFLADRYGFVAPFMAAVAPLVALALIVLFSWNENYGDASLNMSQGLSAGMAALLSNKRVIVLGLGQAMFEGAMYVFVFMWSPALSTPESRGSLPYGFIFAVFMVCVMVGSALFSVLSLVAPLSVMPLILHSAAAVAMAIVALHNDNKPWVYAAFLAFEVSCGLFFPTYGTLRSMYIPESARSAVMNYARIPLNAFVIASLYAVKFVHLEVTTVFWLCAAAHACGLLAYLVFLGLGDPAPPKSKLKAT